MKSADVRDGDDIAFFGGLNLPMIPRREAEADKER